jgi:X-X-X-Leu-X-X-Gly heptad repeat protein
MTLYPFCNPYAWENPKVLLVTPFFMVKDPKEGPCASEYVNQVILSYTVMMGLAALVTVLVNSPFILPMFFGFATLISLPSFIRLSAIQTMREGFSDSDNKIAGMQTAIKETQTKIDFLTASLKDSALNDVEQGNIKQQIARLKGGIEQLNDSISTLQDSTDSLATGSAGSPSSKGSRLPISTAQDVYDVIGLGAAPANLMLPTAKNPFMNVLIDELNYNPRRPLAASVMDPSVKVTLEEFFRTDFYTDPTDVFGKTQSQRQFVTMPSTGIPNDVDSYQNWLYRIPGKTCKEGGREACLPGTDGGALPWLNSLP